MAAALHWLPFEACRIQRRSVRIGDDDEDDDVEQKRTGPDEQTREPLFSVR